jgi:hypothetical protein
MLSRFATRLHVRHAMQLCEFLFSSAKNEKRKTKNEKRKTKNEKRKTKNEKRKTKNEKRKSLRKSSRDSQQRQDRSCSLAEWK